MAVCAVVVTYNRAPLLRRALAALGAQTHPLDEILVVDNASTDGTAGLLADEFGEVQVLRLATNEGGAGGFHEGMRWAHERGFDWLWLMDDDTICEPAALAELLAAEPPSGDAPILASRVIWRDGRLHPMNRPLPRMYDVDDMVLAAERGLLSLRFATFVSLLVHRRAIDEHGLPLKAFFIWSDDIEWTARVLRDEPGYLVPTSIAQHETPTAHTALDASPAKFYFAVRNGIWTVRGSALTFKEKVSHVLALVWTSGAWLGTQRGRPAALGAVTRGVRDGLLKSPR